MRERFSTNIKINLKSDTEPTTSTILGATPLDAPGRGRSSIVGVIDAERGCVEWCWWLAA